MSDRQRAPIPAYSGFSEYSAESIGAGRSNSYLTGPRSHLGDRSRTLHVRRPGVESDDHAKTHCSMRNSGHHRAGNDGDPVEGGDWPFGWKAQPGTPNTPTQVARSIDDIEEKILDDGVVVIKQPDVWGQSRMTLYRKDFESMMKARGPDDFQTILSARVSRLDAAAFQSQTSLSASLASTANGRGRMARPADAGVANAVTSPTIVALHQPSGGSQGQGNASGGAGGGPTPPTGEFWNIAPLPTDAPFGLLPGKQPFTDMSTTYGGKLGLEPPVFLDEKKRFFDHLNELRRINIGDDNADSAGYGLYLVRMPVSLQPGACTLKGHGAVLTVTARHEFNSRTFLKDSFRDLVVNDLVNQLGPIIFELIRSGLLQAIDRDKATLATQSEDYSHSQAEYARQAEELQRRSVENQRARRQNRQKLNQLVQIIGDLSNHIDSWIIEYTDRILNALIDQGTYKGNNPEDFNKGTTLKGAVRSDVIAAVEVALNELKKGSAQGRVAASAQTSISSSKLQQRIDGLKDSLEKFPHTDPAVRASMDRLEAELKVIRDRLDVLKRDLDTAFNGLVDSLKNVGNETRGGALSLISPAEVADKVGKDIDNVENGRPIIPPPPTLPGELRDLKADLSFVALSFYDSARLKINDFEAAISKFKGVVERERPVWSNFVRQDVAPRVRTIPPIRIGGEDQPLTTEEIASTREKIMIASTLYSQILEKYQEFLNSSDEPGGEPSSIKSGPQLQSDLSGLVGAIGKELNRGRMLANEESNLDNQQKQIDTNFTKLKESADKISQLQAGLSIEQVASSAFPSTRFGGRSYPVAPSDIDDVFLTDAIFTLVRKTAESLQTATPPPPTCGTTSGTSSRPPMNCSGRIRATSSQIARLIQDQHAYTRLSREAFPMLMAKLPGELKSHPDDPIAILCWCVAVESGLLNRQLQRDIIETQVEHGSSIADPGARRVAEVLRKGPGPRGRGDLRALRPGPMADDRFRAGPRRRSAEHRRRLQPPSRPPARHRLRLFHRQDQLQSTQPVQSQDRTGCRDDRPEPYGHLLLARDRHLRLAVLSPLSKSSSGTFQLPGHRQYALARRSRTELSDKQQQARSRPARADRRHPHAVVPPAGPVRRHRQLVPAPRPRRDEGPHRADDRARPQGRRPARGTHDHGDL